MVIKRKNLIFNIYCILVSLTYILSINIIPPSIKWLSNKLWILSLFTLTILVLSGIKYKIKNSFIFPLILLFLYSITSSYSYFVHFDLSTALTNSFASSLLYFLLFFTIANVSEYLTAKELLKPFIVGSSIVILLSILVYFGFEPTFYLDDKEELDKYLNLKFGGVLIGFSGIYLNQNTFGITLIVAIATIFAAIATDNNSKKTTIRSIMFFILIITQLIAYRLLRRILLERTGPKSNGYAKKLINYGYKAHLSNILAFVNYRADMLLLSFFIGPAAVGVYTVAVSITEKLWLLSSAISIVLLPKLSQLSTDEDKRKLLTPLIARWVFWLTLVASLVLAAIGSYVVQLIFGSDFIEAYSAMILLIPGIVVGACSKVLANDIAARGRPELNLATSWVAVIINIIGNIILIPRFGRQGAAAATSFAYIINFVMRLAMHNYFTKVPFYKNFIPTLSDFTLLKSSLSKRTKV